MTAAEGMADLIAQTIRTSDGNHSMGAGALGEVIADALVAAGFGDVREAEANFEKARSLGDFFNIGMEQWKERAEKAEAALAAMTAALQGDLGPDDQLQALADRWDAEANDYSARHEAAPYDQGADAWDEGYTSGHSNAMRRMSDEPNAPTTPNPYRADRLPGESE